MTTLTGVAHNHLSVTIMAETRPISWGSQVNSDEVNTVNIHQVGVL